MRYEAIMYVDAEDADYRTHPTAYKIEQRIVTSRDVLILNLASGGGAAVRFRALN
jgi:alpha-glucosidase